MEGESDLNNSKMQRFETVDRLISAIFSSLCLSESDECGKNSIEERREGHWQCGA